MLSGSVKERKEHHMTCLHHPQLPSQGSSASASIPGWGRQPGAALKASLFDEVNRLLFACWSGPTWNRENKAACPANHWKPELLGKSGAKPRKWKCQEFGLFLICFCFRVFHVAGSWFTFISTFFLFLWILVLQVCESVIGLVTSCLTLVVFCPLCCHF